MANNSENKLLEFFTHEENVSSVLEILKKGDRIRDLVLQRFWKDLFSCLQDRVKGLALSQNSMRLERDLTDGEIDYLDINLKNEKYFLCYALIIEETKHHYDMGLAVSWPDFDRTPKGTKLYKLPSLVKVREELESSGFEEFLDNGNTCIGYKAIKECVSRDDFLIDYVAEKKEFLGNICEEFCNLVQGTHTLVAAANKAIVEAGRK